MKPFSVQRWRQVEQLLDAALDVPAEQRAAFLDTACAGDAELRADVDRLLRAGEESEHFLEQPAHEFAAPILASLADDLAPAAPGERIGPYRIVEEAGRGGMAVVFRAERDDGQFRKRVALKLVRPGSIAGEELLRRFREERQILAGLEHPGIARLLDGGVTEEGLPWLAMEYVEGTPIVSYCDERRLSIEARLALFCAVCDAVQYAHRRRIVHRDLKPGNILVVEPDPEEAGEGGEGRVKLLDFGIAKLLAPQSEAEAGERTRPAMRLLTPEYASPEQVRGEAVTPAADVYALGVLLYRLLCGREPCQLPGDLDAIVLKAMSRESEQRYASAGELAAEVRRHLQGRGVKARSEARLRRARSLLLPRGWGVAALTAVVLVAVTVYLATGRPAGSPLDPQRVVVAPFENRTGQPALDPVGSMAADWIIQGLAHTGLVQVVPVAATLIASRFVRGAGEGFDSASRIRLLAEEIGAGIVVSGAFYQQGDSLYLHATVTDAAAGAVLHALEPIAAPGDQPLVGIEELRRRLTGLLAPRFNPRTEHQVGGGLVAPPSFEAYRAHALGMELFISGEWRASVTRFTEAAAHDSSFSVPLLYSAMALTNLGEYAAVASLLDRLRPRLHRLSELERLGYALLQHEVVEGNYTASYEALRRAGEIAPGTLAHWSHSQAAGRVNRPREAIRVARQIDPERGELRGWLPYWQRLAEAYHRVGQHREELRAARRAKELWPGTTYGLTLEISALAGLGRKRELRALLAELPSGTESPAMLLRHAGLEFSAHGHRQDGEALLRGSLEWDLARPEESPAYRRRLAHSHYLVGELDEAERLLRELAAEWGPVPSVQAGLGFIAALRGDVAEARALQRALAQIDGPYQFGAHTYRRAQIAALLGEPDEALRLLRQAWGEGLPPIWEWVHQAPEFDGIRRHPAFREFVRPKG
jgi:tetratricopeptide (TPR) repeat protein/tRNA A-37 threonylcarbamoyl transferase component Bud32/TolB-like protein